MKAKYQKEEKESATLLMLGRMWCLRCSCTLFEGGAGFNEHHANPIFAHKAHACPMYGTNRRCYTWLLTKRNLKMENGVVRKMEIIIYLLIKDLALLFANKQTYIVFFCFLSTVYGHVAIGCDV